jgi:hypothetical protein
MRKKTVENAFLPSVNGVGYLGEALLGVESVRLQKSYITWRGMLGRCYNSKQQEKHPTYVGCSVDERWHNFQVFKEWFDKNSIEGWQLDKDILHKSNKIYSPETCCFVPKEVNILFRKDRNEVGVRKKGNRFEATATFLKKSYLGTFDTIEEASAVYKQAKNTRVVELATLYKGQLLEGCYEALVNSIK